MNDALSWAAASITYSEEGILKYACLYWSHHLLFVSTHSTADVRAVVDFLNSYLYETGDAWLHYMSKDAGTFKIGVQSLDTIEQWGAKISGQFELQYYPLFFLLSLDAMASVESEERIKQAGAHP